jgi:hypothetical protein
MDERGNLTAGHREADQHGNENDSTAYENNHRAPEL